MLKGERGHIEYVCEVGATLAEGIAKAAKKAANHYRGWSISFDFPPIPIRSMDWSATHPDYDASLEDGEWQDNGKRVTAATREDLIKEIDAWIEEHSEDQA